MTWSRIVLVALVAAEAANVAGLAEQRGVQHALAGLVVVGAFAGWRGAHRGELRPGWSPVLPAAVLYAGAIGVTALLSADPAPGQRLLVGTAFDLAWFVVVLVLLSAPGAPGLAAATFVSVLAGLCALTVLQEFVLGNAVTFGGLAKVPLTSDLGSVTARHAGPQVDVNFWGRVLVLGAPLAAGLWAGSERGRRSLWIGCALLLVMGVYLTQSRGALLALTAGAVTWVLLADRRHRRLLLALPVLVAVALAVPGVGSRLATLTDLGASASARPDPSLEGRRSAQQAGLQMFRDHPLLGVGPGRFEEVTPAYQRRVQTSAPGVFAPHDLYLQLAAEGGLVLLAAWLMLLATGTFVALRARVLLRDSSGPDPPLVAGMLGALLAWSTASLFLHLATLRSFLLVIGLAGASDLLARRRRARLPVHRVRTLRPVQVGRTTHGMRRRVRVTASAGATALVLLALGLSSTRSTPQWQASAQAEMVVRQPGAYADQVLGRDAVMLTFARIVAEGDFRQLAAAAADLTGARLQTIDIQVHNEPRSRLLVVLLTGADRDAVARLAPVLLPAVAVYLDQIAPLYRLQPGSTTTPRQLPARRFALWE